MSVLSLSAIGRDARQPAPRSASNHSPLLISTTQPATTSPIVGSPSPSGASATLVQAASKPASAGRVPSIGSTIEDELGVALPGATIPRSSE